MSLYKNHIISYDEYGGANDEMTLLLILLVDILCTHSAKKLIVD